MDVPQRKGRQLAMMAFVDSYDGLVIKISTAFEFESQQRGNIFAANIILENITKKCEY
jgi:hypothetical protein